MVEVGHVEVMLSTVRLRGTASVYEGNLLAHLQADDGEPGEWHVFQASAGGPGRGTWEMELSVPAWPVRLKMGEEDAKNGGLSARSVVMLVIGLDGRVAQAASS